MSGRAEMNMPKGRNKTKWLILLFPVLAILGSGCRSVNYTANMTGLFDNVSLVSKSFVVVGSVSVHTSEIHSSGPLGIVKKLEGSKVTYNDLIQTAAVLNADDIIDVRIDISTVAKTSFVDWLTGWERTYTYTGSALAIVYVDKSFQEDTPASDGQDQDTLDLFRR